MFLAIDIGNSHTSFGVYEENELKHHWRMPTKSSVTKDEIAAFVLPLLANVKMNPSFKSGVALCSVVPPVDAAFGQFCKDYLGSGFFQITPDMKLDFKLNVVEPHTVGADRIANAAFAISKENLPALVVDFGTATTIDVISKEGNYEGGAILPGIRLAFESLGHKTSQLTTVDTHFPDSVIGKTTAECIQSGILFGYVDLVDGLIERNKKALGDCTVFLTGGFAPAILERIKAKGIYEANLTLEGIRLLYLKHS